MLHVARFVAVNQIFIILGSSFSGFDVSETVVKCALISHLLKAVFFARILQIKFCPIHVFYGYFFVYFHFSFTLLLLIPHSFIILLWSQVDSYCKRNRKRRPNYYSAAKLTSVNLFPFNVTFKVTCLKVLRKILICSVLTVQNSNKKMYLFHLETNEKDWSIRCRYTISTICSLFFSVCRMFEHETSIFFNAGNTAHRIGRLYVSVMLILHFCSSKLDSLNIPF